MHKIVYLQAQSENIYNCLRSEMYLDYTEMISYFKFYRITFRYFTEILLCL